MVRAPCCEKMGLKKGPWAPEEDQILVSYIQRYGHSNWRALPKQAGLLRCGKSCRLRWINYLHPDIKRGNFSREEEDTIIKLHEMLGNRWSAIAARLPGRTDNEIKNVWHTHLKKRLKQNQTNPDFSIKLEPENFSGNSPATPEQSSSDISSSGTDFSMVTSENNKRDNMDEVFDFSSEAFFKFDEDFCSETLSMENSGMLDDLPADPQLHEFNFSSVSTSEFTEPIFDRSSKMEERVDFWYNLFINS